MINKLLKNENLPDLTIIEIDIKIFEVSTDTSYTLTLNFACGGII